MRLDGGEPRDGGIVVPGIDAGLKCAAGQVESSGNGPKPQTTAQKRLFQGHICRFIPVLPSWNVMPRFSSEAQGGGRLPRRVCLLCPCLAPLPLFATFRLGLGGDFARV